MAELEQPPFLAPLPVIGTNAIWNAVWMGWYQKLLMRMNSPLLLGYELTDPAADRLLGWSNTDDAMAWISIGSRLTLTGNVLSADVQPQTGGMVLLDTQTTASSATMDFVTGLTSTYSTYLFDLTDILPETDDVGMGMQVSVDAGANWLAADYTWAALGRGNGTYAADGAGAASMLLVPGASIGAGEAIGNAAGEGLSGQVNLFNPSGSSFKRVRANLSYLDPSTRSVVFSSSGSYVGATTAITGVRFSLQSGDIASGTGRLYGLTK